VNPRRIPLSRRAWTDADRAVLAALYPEYSAEECANVIGRSVRSVYSQAALMGLKKSLDWIAQRARQGTLKPTHGCRRFQFHKEQTPWNKGISHPTRGRSAETQFKVGRPPSHARNYRPIGSTRISKDGVLERKVSDDQSIAPTRRWVAVHRLVWEEAHGPIPNGYIVAFKPGMRSIDPEHITPSALELITRAESMSRNTIHHYPPEVTAAIRLVNRAQRALENRSE